MKKTYPPPMFLLIFTLFLSVVFSATGTVQTRGHPTTYRAPSTVWCDWTPSGSVDLSQLNGNYFRCQLDPDDCSTGDPISFETVVWDTNLPFGPVNKIVARIQKYVYVSGTQSGQYADVQIQLQANTTYGLCSSNKAIVYNDGFWLKNAANQVLSPFLTNHSLPSILTSGLLLNVLRLITTPFSIPNSEYML